MRKFEYQWRQVTRCKENSHIMPALQEFGCDGWEVFMVESIAVKDDDLYGLWMRREIEQPVAVVPDQPST